MRRVLIALFAAVALLAVAARAAPAATVTIERSQHEIDRSRVVLSESLEAFKAGDRDRAYALSRAAYLDHFEFVEIPLRLRNPNLVIDTEFKYAKLRNDIKDGASVDQVRKDTAVNPRPANAAVVPAAIAAATRALMNSMRRLCSSRATSQKLTPMRTTTAMSAVTASSSSRLSGATSITSVASTNRTAVATRAAPIPIASGRL